MKFSQKYPEPTVGALIFNTSGELLLLKSHKWHGKYTVPGGHIELGESMEDALRREVKEETGLEVSGLEFLCWQEFIYDEAFFRPRHFIFFDFSCHTNETVVRLNRESQEYIWARPEHALRLSIDAYTQTAIQEYLQLNRDDQNGISPR